MRRAHAFAFLGLLLVLGAAAWTGTARARAQDGTAAASRNAAAPAEPRSADPDEPWIHVQVLEPGGTDVKIALPLSLVDVALDLAPDDAIVDGRLKVFVGRRHGRAGRAGAPDHPVRSVSDLRRLWRELRAAGEGEFVTVRSPEEKVSVARRGERMLVEVEHGDDDRCSVRIEAPVRVLDALLAGEGETLDLRAALDALRTNRGEILAVNDERTRVRIWIGERTEERR